MSSKVSSFSLEIAKYSLPKYFEMLLWHENGNKLAVTSKTSSDKQTVLLSGQLTHTPHFLTIEQLEQKLRNLKIAGCGGEESCFVFFRIPALHD